MSDQPSTPDSHAAEPSGQNPTPPSASDSAEQALRAAQDAVSALKSEAGVDPEGTSEAIRAAQAAIAQAKASQRSSGAGVHGTGGGRSSDNSTTPLPIPEFDAAGESNGSTGLELLSDVNLHVKVELGRTRMYVEDILRLGPGSVVELDKLAGDPVDIYVNERRVARGEVLVLNDNFCVRVNEILADAIEKK